MLIMFMLIVFSPMVRVNARAGIPLALDSSD
ncbi:hypothetical protein mEp515_18 [Escherichia phage mEp515]|nr:MAG TPA: hypothetical protein [Caudoviricetes sp.]